MTWKIWLRHQLLGVPLAALLHSVLQFAHAYSPKGDNDWSFLAVHWAAGMLFGSVVLVPSFTVQAWIAVGLGRRRSGAGMQILAGGLTQAAVAALWAQFAGIEPSLPGNFPLTAPMIGAAFLAGGTVAAFAAPRAAGRPESTFRDLASERTFGYRSLRAFMAAGAMICFAGAVILAFLLRNDPSEAVTAFGCCAAAALFCYWGGYAMSAEVGVSDKYIVWTRGRREVAIPWPRVTEVRSTLGDELLIRSEEAKIGVDKQLDDYGEFYGLVQKYAPSYAWKALSLPLQCRANLLAPGLLFGFGMAWLAAMWWLADYSPPRDSTDRMIVTGALSFGALSMFLALYLATFRCEFTLAQIRAGYLFRQKTYEVAKLSDMRLATVDTSEAAREIPGTIMPPLSVQQIEFRFEDGRELKLSANRISVAPEALYRLLRQYYSVAGELRRRTN